MKKVLFSILLLVFSAFLLVSCSQGESGNNAEDLAKVKEMLKYE